MVERINILGAPLDCVNMEDALKQVDKMVQSKTSNTIIALNPEKVIKSQNDSEILGWLRKAKLVIPDGIGVVVATRMLHNIKLSRVPGAELMPAICEHSVSKGYKLFLYGASAETIEKAVNKLGERYRGIQITGYQHGYLPEDQMPSLIDRINQSQANILFVALGSPRQELWMDTYLGQLENIQVCQGVGGTFDVIAGSVKRAPNLFIKMNIEWLYRLLSQPNRLLRQTALPIFVCKVVSSVIKKNFSQ